MVKLWHFKEKLSNNFVDVVLCIPCAEHLEKQTGMRRAIPIKTYKGKRCFVCSKE